MAHDPARVADTAGWLHKAREDLEIASQLANPSLFGGAVFHCQQAAEKALKAVLVWHDLPFRKTHYLKELGDACITIDPISESDGQSRRAANRVRVEIPLPR
ncbi:MAG: HEPN domain-containing protein [Candidatus Binataceae bacterium]